MEGGGRFSNEWRRRDRAKMAVVTAAVAVGLCKVQYGVQLQLGSEAEDIPAAFNCVDEQGKGICGIETPFTVI